MKEYDGKKLYNIDGVPTAIDSVHGNLAKGYYFQPIEGRRDYGRE